MSRSSISIALASALTLAAAGGCSSQDARSARVDRPSGPNVLLITVDTLRPDHLGSYGYARETSPAIDRLAERGVRFEHAIAQRPKTSPSIASLFTSLYPHEHGVWNTRQSLEKKHLALAELFGQSGFATGAVVTNANLGRAYNFDQGFDDFVEVWREHPEQNAEEVSDGAIAWLEGNASGDEAFFLWLHYCDPHAKYEPPAPFDEMFVGDDRFASRGRAPLNPGKDDDIGGIPARSHLGEKSDLDYYVAQYDAEIRYMDSHIERVLATLERLARHEETVVVLTADHGESLGEHNYFFEHGRLPYEPGSRVPLVVAGPAVRKGIVIEDPVELIDVMPTMLELAEIAPHDATSGESLLPRINDASAGSRYAFSDAGYHDAAQRSVRDERWKLIWIPDERDRRIMSGAEYELYDLATDRAELTNLHETHPVVAARLKAELFRWSASSSDTGGRQPVAHAEDPQSLESLRSLGYVE